MKVPRLRSLRERRGFTQRELAQAADVARRSIAGWESGKSIRPNSASKVAEALGVSISDLCEEWIEATINLAHPSTDDRTEQLLAMLRRYEEMAERRETFDFSAADLTQVSGYLATESIYGAAKAAERGDHVVVAEILGRATRVLGWLQKLVVGQEEKEAKARAAISDPMDVILENWSTFGLGGSGHLWKNAARSARAGIRGRPQRGKSDG